MIITTTNSIEGLKIDRYIGLVTEEVIAGVNLFKGIGAGLRNLFDGRLQGYENELQTARENAQKEFVEHAEKLEADAVVGVDLDYEVLEQGDMLVVSVTGTAVTPSYGGQAQKAAPEGRLKASEPRGSAAGAS